jgi:type VI secretion system protein ImpE
MLADEELRRGDPVAALRHLQEIVRKDPSTSSWRIYLFQLLTVLGEWDRAATQLGVLADLDGATELMVRAYREVLLCEALRKEIFAGRRAPVLFGEPEPWMAWMTEAAALHARGEVAEGAQLRTRALEESPTVGGTIDGKPFAWIADADSRLGPLLEAIVLGQYVWVPFVRVREIAIEKPQDLRDLVWAPAEFTWANGGRAVGFIPTRYEGTESSGDGLLRLSRKTEWTDAGDGVFTGLGQRVLTTDDGDHPLLEIRSIRFEAP